MFLVFLSLQIFQQLACCLFSFKFCIIALYSYLTFRFNVPQENDEKKNFNFKQLEEALKNFDSNDVYTYDHYKENHVKDSRMSSEQAQSVLHGGFPGYGK